MEKAKSARVAWAGLVAGLLITLAVIVPSAHHERRIGMSPEEAVDRILMLMPAPILPAGELRGWARSAGGWLVTFQPAHGSWLTQVWVGDLGEVGELRVIAASWLPGARLSRTAALTLAGIDAAGYDAARDRLARRDWRIGDRSLLGALPAGGVLPRNLDEQRFPWAEALVAGLLLAGAMARRLSPHLRSARWPFPIAVTSLIVFVATQSTIFPERAFSVEVRPWVAQLAFDIVLLLLLGGISYAAYQFPSARQVPMGGVGVFVFVGGVVSGRLQPVVAFTELGGLPLAILLLPALSVLGGWLVGLAADGVRGLLPAHRLLQIAAGAGGVCVSWLFWGPWLGWFVVLAGCLFVRRGATTSIAVVGFFGWMAASVGAIGEWPMAQYIWLALLITGSMIVITAFYRDACLENTVTARFINWLMSRIQMAKAAKAWFYLVKSSGR